MEPLTVTRLLQVQKVIPLGERKVLVRALSSADLRAQSFAASLAGLRMKQRLADPDGDTYQALVMAALVFADRAQLTDWIMGFKLADLQREAFERHQEHLVPFPDDATEDERMATLAQREKVSEQLIADRTSYVVKGLDAYKVELADKTDAELQQLYVDQRLKDLINGEWRLARDSAELLHGVRSLDGEAYFASLDEAAQLPESVRQYLLSEVRSVNDIDPLNWSLPSSTDSPQAPGS